MRAARAGEDAADASLIDARFQQALTTTNQFLDALAAAQLLRVREASVRRAEEQLKTSVAKLRAGSATRSDSLRSLVTLGTARLDLITDPDPAGDRRSQSGAADRRNRPGAAPPTTPPSISVRRRSTPRPSAPKPSPSRPGSERGRQRRPRRGPRCAPPAPPTGPRSPWPRTPAGMAAGPTTTTLLNQRQVSLSLRWNLFNGFDRELTIVQREADSIWPRPPPPTRSARCRPS